MTVRPAAGERVWNGLPEVNRQAVVRQLARLAGRTVATTVATGERDLP
ncbi:hypothetical protein [Streptomyces sp. NPDC050485]